MCISPANQRLIERMRAKQQKRQAVPSVPLPAEHKADRNPVQDEATRHKQDEFPNIAWDNTLDRNVQLCQLLYNERVRTFQQMRRMLQDLDEAAIPEDFGKQFAALDESNRQAHQEIENFNATGRFLLIHPISKQFTKK